MDNISIQPISISDRPWARRLLVEHWGSVQIISKGRIHQADQLEGLIALYQGLRAGLLTYLIADNACEIVSVDSLVEGRGIASALIKKVKNIAKSSGWERIWLITTNDNLLALRFYQKRVFKLVTLHAGAIERSRKLKPSIPFHGMYGIPIRDELELAYQPPSQNEDNSMKL